MVKIASGHTVGAGAADDRADRLARTDRHRTGLQGGDGGGTAELGGDPAFEPQPPGSLFHGAVADQHQFVHMAADQIEVQRLGPAWGEGAGLGVDPVERDQFARRTAGMMGRRTARLNPDLPVYTDYDQLMRLDEWLPTLTDAERNEG